MREIDDLFGQAVQHHRSGRLAEAERYHRQVLAIDARHADSLHLLGIIASQAGRHGDAIELIGQAIRLRDDVPAYHNNLGHVCLGHGKAADAVIHCERALALRPDFAEAHYNLGNARNVQGDLPEAMASYQRVIALRPDHPEAYNNLGNTLLGQGRAADAIESYRRAIALKPDFAAAHTNLGNAFLSHARLNDAAACHERALALKPDFAEAHNNLGNVLVALGQIAEAVPHFETALALKPDYAEAHNNLGNAHMRQGGLAEAVLHYEQALAQRPDYAEAHTNLGNALLGQGKLSAAIACHQRALALKADFAEAHHNLGNAFVDQGRFDAAQLAYERAIELEPRQGRHYRALVNTRRVTAGDRHLAAMEGLARDMPSLSPAEQTELHFALGKAFADLGRIERSFHHLLDGNALRRRELVYDETAALGMADQIRTVFTADLMHGKAGFGDPSPVPIFIVGMPRSGTTLIEQILASHPKVFGAGERQDFARLALTLMASRDVHASFAEAVPALTNEMSRELGGAYLRAVGSEAPRATRITDKMPGNFPYVGLIHLALPNARIVHMRRDPVDTCLSCFSTLFATGHPYSYDLAELSRFYRAYEAVMEHWRQVLPAGVMIEVRYEDVVADVERQARRVVAHCGLDWDESCLAFHETRRAVQTASAIQVRQPIYRTSVGRWRAYSHLLRPLIVALDRDRPDTSI